MSMGKRRFAFAPGAVELHRARRLARWLRAWAPLLALLAVVALMSMASGYLHARGWL